MKKKDWVDRLESIVYNLLTAMLYHLSRLQAEYPPMKSAWSVLSLVCFFYVQYYIPVGS